MFLDIHIFFPKRYPLWWFFLQVFMKIVGLRGSALAVFKSQDLLVLDNSCFWVAESYQGYFLEVEGVFGLFQEGWKVWLNEDQLFRLLILWSPGQRWTTLIMVQKQSNTSQIVRTLMLSWFRGMWELRAKIHQPHERYPENTVFQLLLTLKIPSPWRRIQKKTTLAGCSSTSWSHIYSRWTFKDNVILSWCEQWNK